MKGHEKPCQKMESEVVYIFLWGHFNVRKDVHTKSRAVLSLFLVPHFSRPKSGRKCRLDIRSLWSYPTWTPWLWKLPGLVCRRRMTRCRGPDSWHPCRRRVTSWGWWCKSPQSDASTDDHRASPQKPVNAIVTEATFSEKFTLPVHRGNKLKDVHQLRQHQLW